MVAPGLTIRCIKLSCGIRRWSAGGTTRTQKTPVRRAFFYTAALVQGGVIHTPERSWCRYISAVQQWRPIRFSTASASCSSSASVSSQPRQASVMLCP